ncbi:polysaccharide deacetylase family protein [Algoriphagus sp.]|uniref:polysaccharide deacetylase family protein n=1 Tax=Algoriphagus sp. TaxID=1872435 RepID=UPI00261BFFD4|nr:polysaccharide deacetylase family protein [Algoriphagus sp.]
MKKIVWLSFCVFLGLKTYGQQKSISITIDDIPNTEKFQQDGFRSVLLDRLDSLDIPFTIFINEKKVFQTDFLDKNKNLLARWIAHENSTPGNHGYSHLRYSEVGFDDFVQDINKGLKLSDSIAMLHDKSMDSFRFPFNDLGKDSVQQAQIRSFLKFVGDRIAPFTIESSDWMFDSVYRYYLENGEEEKARKIGESYVTKTLELVRFFEEMAAEIYHRPISHIYLCHDNVINAAFLDDIVSELSQEGYSIVPFEDSLKDPVYDQEDNYFQKWGVSWLYRWMDSQEERVGWMKKEPDLTEIQRISEHISQIQSHK